MVDSDGETPITATFCFGTGGAGGAVTRQYTINGGFHLHLSGSF